MTIAPTLATYLEQAGIQPEMLTHFPQPVGIPDRRSQPRLRQPGGEGRAAEG
jgi:hypothetical protein